MNTRTRIWPRVAAALVMALAAGLTWGFVAAWGGYLISSLWGSGDSVYEYLNVTRDGTPLIQTSSSRWVEDETFRTLDGQPYDVENPDFLPGAYFTSLPKTPGLVEMPVPWSQRVAGMSDQRRPPTSWYLIRDAEPLGHAYLVGYDELSRLCVGYIGRAGFRRARPPQDEWFDLGRHTLTWYGPLACAGELEFGGRVRGYVYSYSGDEPLPPWAAFLIDGDRLLEINLRTRSVRPLLEAPGMLNVGIAWEQPRLPQVDAAEPETPPPAAEAAAARRREPLISRVALRLADRIVVLDPSSGEKREFLLPGAIRDKPLQAYIIRPNELFIQSWPVAYFRGPSDLTWLEPDGKVVRQQTIVLARPTPPSERQTAWAVAGVAPVPIGWLAGLTVAAPLVMLQSGSVANYADGLAKGFDIAWMPLVAVVVVGALLAWQTHRLQRKYRRRATGVWTTFVLLLGLPGFFAYWLEQRRPKLEPCESCDEIVPRDREACAACDAQFPTPPLVGTEIYA